MKFIIFLSNTAILFFLLITVIFAIIERKNVLELFFEGVIEGEKIVIGLFPTLLALIVAVEMLNKSGIIYFFSDLITPILKVFKIEKTLAPLILIRPISGSTTTAVATSLMKQYGVDSQVGLIASCIMGSTETTIYVASIYSSKIKVKNIKEVIIIGLTLELLLSSIFSFSSLFIFLLFISLSSFLPLILSCLCLFIVLL